MELFLGWTFFVIVELKWIFQDTLSDENDTKHNIIWGIQL